MTKNISEEELLLRKRARRRLVGAIVLVLISVVVLPAIFDEPQSESEKHEIVINLPATGKDNKDLIAPPKKEDSPERELLGIAEVPESQNKTKVAAQDSGEIIESPGEQKRIPLPGIKPKIERPSTPVKSANVAGLVNPSGTVSTAPNVTAAQTTGAAAATAPDAAKGLVIQLGAFSDPSKAKQQQANLLANGFKAYTETSKIDSNEVTRVRIGPFMTRSAAENELKKVRKLGLDGVIVPR